MHIPRTMQLCAYDEDIFNQQNLPQIHTGHRYRCMHGVAMLDVAYDEPLSILKCHNTIIGVRHIFYGKYYRDQLHASKKYMIGIKRVKSDVGLGWEARPTNTGYLVKNMAEHSNECAIY